MTNNCVRSNPNTFDDVAGMARRKQRAADGPGHVHEIDQDRRTGSGHAIDASLALVGNGLAEGRDHQFGDGIGIEGSHQDSRGTFPRFDQPANIVTQLSVELISFAGGPLGRPRNQGPKEAKQGLRFDEGLVKNPEHESSAVPGFFCNDCN
jgi:hypothetical protein